MIHYHGTPISPRSQLEKMAGRHFCVSFAAPRDRDWCMKNGQSVMWDNGAFSFFRVGKPVSWTRFYGWLEPRLFHPHWAVIPDVIDGPEEEQRELLKSWPFALDKSAAVWHLGLPIDYLMFLADNYPRVCFGSSGLYWKIGSDDWRSRVDEAFNALESRGHRNWIHMLRAMGEASKGPWPFASADSTNIARNHTRRGRTLCPEQMARLIDSSQPSYSPPSS